MNADQALQYWLHFSVIMMWPVKDDDRYIHIAANIEYVRVVQNMFYII